MASSLQYSGEFIHKLKEHGVQVRSVNDQFEFIHRAKRISLPIYKDQLSQPEKLYFLILSKLGLNKRVFARKCELKEITKEESANFLNTYHLMGSTACAYAIGLFHEEELLCVATFSKGRRMNRLPAGKRSFELIRFCTKGTYTVVGGMTRLLKYFCRSKQAGDIMTYVSTQFTEGASFVRAGFSKAAEHGSTRMAVDTLQNRRRLLKEGEGPLAGETEVKGPGMLKMIYTCHEGIQ